MLDILIYFVLGFCAQMIDGALGMAFGAINMTVLLTLGLPPSTASACVHMAEVGTTAASSFSHAMFKNIRWELILRLAIPGIIGSVIGSYLLTQLPVAIIRPFIAVYLMVVGSYIFLHSIKSLSFWEKIKEWDLFKRFRKEEEIPDHVQTLSMPIGFAGGFFDAMGGGGWGAIVTSSLLVQGSPPRYTIGSVNFVEFLIATSSSITFYMLLGFEYFNIVAGLVLGGMVAAPFGAYFLRKIHPRYIMRFVSIVLFLLSIRIFYTSFTE